MDTNNPVLPHDETRLIIDGISKPSADILANIPVIADNISTTNQEVVSDILADIAVTASVYDTARADVVTEALSDIGTIESSIVDAYVPVMKAADRTIKKITDDYENNQAELFINGVKTPNGIEQIMNDLSDPSGNAFINAYATTFSDMSAGATADEQPDAIICPAGMHSVRVFNPNNGVYDYQCVPDNPDSQIVTDANGNIAVIVPVATTNPIDQPATIPPPVVPPPVIIPPTSTPSIPVSVDACEAESIPTVQVGCYQLPAEQVRIRYWITVDCADCKRPKACVYAGVRPPTDYVGILQSTVYDTQPTETQLRTLAIQCVKDLTGIDIVSPPTSPPPPAEEIESEDDAGTEAVCPAIDTEVIGDVIANSITSATCTVSTKTEPIVDADNKSTLAWGNLTNCREYHDNQIKAYESTANKGFDGKPITNNERLGNILIPFAKLMPGVSMFSPLFATLAPKEAEKGLDTLAGEIAATGSDAIAEAIFSIPSINVPNKRAALLIGGGIAVADRLQRVTGFPLDYLMTGDTYAYQYANPQYIPSQAEINGMYLTNAITSEQWSCYTKAHGNITSLASIARDAGQTKPNVNELISLYQRGHIESESTLFDRMRADGVISTVYADEYLKLAQSTPQIQDIVSFMVKDVFDKDTVTKYSLDYQFDKKYSGNADKLGKAVGFDKETARLYWRAHWHTPSDTALYTMIHRLNPRRPEVLGFAETEENEGIDAAVTKYGPKPVTFDEDELRYALTINDNSPTFIDKLVAIQYRPITNTDASRMYELGYITDEQFKWRVVANGYTETDAEVMVGFYKAQRTKRLSNDTGVWTGRKIISAFKDGLITREQADSLLAEKIVDPAIREQTLNYAYFEMETDTKRIQQKALKKRYMFGQLSNDMLRGELEKINVSPVAIASLVERWEAEKFGRAREPRVAEICKWFNAGYIGIDEYWFRLDLMGYDGSDIQRIIGTCTNEHAAKKAKEAAAEAIKLRKESERLMRNERNDLAEQLKKLKANIRAAEQQYADLMALVAGTS